MKVIWKSSVVGSASAQSFMSVDPMASKYPHASPYNYCLGNPINRFDPDGQKIIYSYERFSSFGGLEKRLNDNLSNATTRQERRLARQELRANRENINGYNNYVKVQGLINDFKSKNEEEFNRVDNLKLDGKNVDVNIRLNGSFSGSAGQVGQTDILYNDFANVTDYETQAKSILPISIRNNQIDVTLYKNGQNLSTLANEFGDSIFGVENPGTNYIDYQKNTPYLDRSTTKFSFDYESYIMNGGKKPVPDDYSK